MPSAWHTICTVQKKVTMPVIFWFDPNVSWILLAFPIIWLICPQMARWPFSVLSSKNINAKLKYTVITPPKKTWLITPACLVCFYLLSSTLPVSVPKTEGNTAFCSGFLRCKTRLKPVSTCPGQDQSKAHLPHSLPHLGHMSKKLWVAQVCPILCEPMDSSVHGILQARILEWVAIPFSRG